MHTGPTQSLTEPGPPCETALPQFEFTHSFHEPEEASPLCGDNLPITTLEDLMEPGL